MLDLLEWLNNMEMCIKIQRPGVGIPGHWISRSTKPKVTELFCFRLEDVSSLIQLAYHFF